MSVETRSLRSSMTSRRSRRSASVSAAKSQSSLASRCSFASLARRRAWEPSARLTARWWGSRGGRAWVAVEPGRIYQINATSFRTQGRGMISLVPMPKGSALTFRNVAPSQFSGPKLDQPVPYLGS